MSVTSHASRAAELFVEWIELSPQSRSARLRELLAVEPELGAELAVLLQRFDADPAPPDMAQALGDEVSVGRHQAGQRRASGPNGPRNALRLRLGAAERLLDADQEALAQALMVTTLASAAPTAATEGGMDATLLALWRGRGDSTATADQVVALRALKEHLGPTHPSVVRWQRQVAP